MKCLICESLSFSHICSTCKKEFLSPSLYRRKLGGGIEVISFYRYEEIKELLHTKHTDLGYYIYSILAKNSFAKFADEFRYDKTVFSIAVDDTPRGGYSHTALLNRALRCNSIKPLHNRLRAKNKVSYSGKSREFRLLNPRDFELKNLQNSQVILVDDIITTGSTFTQAIEALATKGNKVLFCLALADARLK